MNTSVIPAKSPKVLRFLNFLNKNVGISQPESDDTLKICSIQVQKKSLKLSPTVPFSDLWEQWCVWKSDVKKSCLLVSYDISHQGKNDFIISYYEKEISKLLVFFVKSNST